jgi:hypothetical protein
MIAPLARSLQSYLLGKGIEVRKAPGQQKSQISVFRLAVHALMMQKRQEPLSFIRIGANDGVYGDPLRSYIRRFAWKGILVEPQPDVFARLVENYSDCADHLIFENVAISPVDTQVTLFRVPGLTALSGQKMQDSLTVTSMYADVVARQGGVDAHSLERVVVPALTLDALIKRHDFSSFDLLQVDCEGFDGEVLKTLDLNTSRPSLIQFEHGHMQRQDLNDLERRFAAHDYELLYGGRFADSLAMPRNFLESLA